MPELTYTDAELGLSPGWDEHLDPNIRRELRDARILAAKLTAAEADLATERRARVLMQAGIPADKRGEAFAQLYKDSTDDPSKVKAAFEELFGPVSTEPAGAPAGEPDPNLTAEQRIAAAASGGTGTQGGQTGTVDLAEAIKGAKDAEEVKAIIRRASETATFAPGQMIPRLPEDQ